MFCQNILNADIDLSKWIPEDPEKHTLVKIDLSNGIPADPDEQKVLAIAQQNGMKIKEKSRGRISNAKKKHIVSQIGLPFCRVYNLHRNKATPATVN
jgi:hypothetical protein